MANKLIENSPVLFKTTIILSDSGYNLEISGNSFPLP